jgi:hypothetical protein
MADADERRRVLDMLAEGRISAGDAAELLKALGEDATPGAAAPKPARKGTARTFRVTVDAFDKHGGDKKAKVRVNIPIGLARFASRFLPPEAKAELDAQGIDLAALIDALGDDVPDGPLVDIDVDDGESGAKRAKIIIEVA